MITVAVSVAVFLSYVPCRYEWLQRFVADYEADRSLALLPNFAFSLPMAALCLQQQQQQQDVAGQQQQQGPARAKQGGPAASPASSSAAERAQPGASSSGGGEASPHVRELQ